MANTIILRGTGVWGEGIAGATITPGALIAYTGAQDGVLTVEPHGTAGGAALPAFATEAGFVGRGIDDNYSSGERVPYLVAAPGARINALLAAGAAATIGALLESAGDGTLRPVTTGTPIAVAVQAVDNSAGGTPARLAVEVL